MRFCPSFLLSRVHSLRWRGLTVVYKYPAQYLGEGGSFSLTGQSGWCITPSTTESLGVVWILSQAQWGSPWSKPGICNWPVTTCQLLFFVDVMLPSPWCRPRLNQRPRLWEALDCFLPPLRPLLWAAALPSCPCSYPSPPSMPSTPGDLWHPTLLHAPCHTQPSCPWKANSFLLRGLKQASKHNLTPL